MRHIGRLSVAKSSAVDYFDGAQMKKAGDSPASSLVILFLRT
jgi:hypothetical protein